MFIRLDRSNEWPREAHTRVIRVRRMTTVSPPSGSRLKKIADSSPNVMGRKTVN